MALAPIVLQIALSAGLVSSLILNQERLARGTLPNLNCAQPRVFDVGLPRTGTDSFCEFGERLGYKSYHVIHREPEALHRCVTNASACQALIAATDRSTPDMFCDVPMTGIGCQLASAFPQASFVLLRRPFESYYKSARFWLCKWGVPKVCNMDFKEDDIAWSKRTHIELYGEAYEEFCKKVADKATAESLCGDGHNHGGNEEEVWDDMGLTPLVQQMHAHHDTAIQECIPSERLLVLDLEATDDEKVEKLGSFLGCSGGVMPDYPHNHCVGCKKKKIQ